MFVPKHFQNDNEIELKDFIRQNGFGISINQTQGKLWGTHVPLELSIDGTTLHGHISKANKQLDDIFDQSEVLVIFQGPHAYISSSWYNHENVPTWNYIAVHVYGTIRLVTGGQLLQSLKTLVDKYESGSTNPVSLEGMSKAYIDKAIKGVTGFEITISRLEAAYKFSQNRDDVNHEAIIEKLNKRGDSNSSHVADAMRKQR